MRIFGAGGGTRTHTPSLTTDFESVSSASSNTPAYIHNEIGATGRIRTGDLFITSELLYLLSHISTLFSARKRGYYLVLHSYG